MAKRIPITIDTIKAKTTLVNDCWMWDGPSHPQGYPMTRFNNKMNLTARVLKQDTVDYPFQKAHRIKNNCGHVKCVNPDHYDIMVPSDEKYSTSHGKHRHSRAQAAAWKAEFDSTPPKWGKNSKLAIKYGIHENVMARITQNAYYIDRPDKKDDPK